MDNERTAGPVEGISGMQEEINELAEEALEEHGNRYEEPETELDY